MAEFEIGWVGEYTPQNVEENDFLNDKLENDMYGIYYSVKFSGDADTYLLQAKKPPVEGQAEWGMIEMSKSGKSKRFKRVKREGSPASSSGPQSSEKAYMKDTSDLPYRVWKDMLPLMDAQQLIKSPDYNRQLNEYVMDQANELLAMIDKVRTSGSLGTPTVSTIKEAIIPAAEPPIKEKLDKGWSKEELDSLIEEAE